MRAGGRVAPTRLPLKGPIRRLNVSSATVSLLSEKARPCSMWGCWPWPMPGSPRQDRPHWLICQPGGRRPVAPSTAFAVLVLPRGERPDVLHALRARTGRRIRVPRPPEPVSQSIP